jgi:hypothetical protein
MVSEEVNPHPAKTTSGGRGECRSRDDFRVNKPIHSVSFTDLSQRVHAVVFLFPHDPVLVKTHVLVKTTSNPTIYGEWLGLCVEILSE